MTIELNWILQMCSYVCTYVLACIYVSFYIVYVLLGVDNSHFSQNVIHLVLVWNVLLLLGYKCIQYVRIRIHVILYQYVGEKVKQFASVTKFCDSQGNFFHKNYTKHLPSLYVINWQVRSGCSLSVTLTTTIKTTDFHTYIQTVIHYLHLN